MKHSSMVVALAVGASFLTILGTCSAFAPIADSSAKRKGLASRPETFSLVNYMNGPVFASSVADAPPSPSSSSSLSNEAVTPRDTAVVDLMSKSTTFAKVSAFAPTNTNNAMSVGNGSIDKQQQQQTEEQVLEPVPTTMPAAIRRFFFGKDAGPILVVASIASFVHSRLILAPLSATDFVAFSASILFWWFQEHVMHGTLLHSTFDWMGKRIHQAHHERNYFHVSIDSPELIMGWLLAVHFLLRMALPLPVALSATVGYAMAGLFYEWAHYIVHTKVKPRGSFMKRMRDNHIRHHQIDDRYWLAFSIPSIDDLFGTNPSVKEAREEKK